MNEIKSQINQSTLNDTVPDPRNSARLRKSYLFDDEIAYAIAPPIDTYLEELKEQKLRERTQPVKQIIREQSFRPQAQMLPPRAPSFMHLRTQDFMSENQTMRQSNFL